jgi:hypothetical protein
MRIHGTNGQVGNFELGSWRDNAAEKCGAMARRSPVGVKIELISPEGEVLATMEGQRSRHL